MKQLFFLWVPTLLAIAGLSKLHLERRRRRLAGGDPTSPYELKRRRAHSEAARILILGSAVTAAALWLSFLELPLAQVACAFFLVVGYQLLLNALGIKHEILANNEAPLPRWSGPPPDPDAHRDCGAPPLAVEDDLIDYVIVRPMPSDRGGNRIGHGTGQPVR